MSVSFEKHTKIYNLDQKLMFWVNLTVKILLAIPSHFNDYKIA